MRARFRSQVQDEVKAAAADQLAAGGVQAVSINAIAKTLGVSGPALYRYFRNREALIDALVVDAYSDLTVAVEGSTDLDAFANRFRGWALEHPHRYRLLFAAPPAVADDLSTPVVSAAHALMLMLAGVVSASRSDDPPLALERGLARWAADRHSDISPSTGLIAIQVWTFLHGFITLEIDGNFASMGLDADLLFATQIASLSR